MTKETFLHDKHIQLGARMVDFAGWHMPVQYTSIIEEHKTVRENVMFRIWAKCLFQEKILLSS